MTIFTYAQNLEDVVLFRALREVSQGFYIDVGANHPAFDSVTRCFYDLGWHGINIEPLRSCIHKLNEERTRDTNIQAIASCSTAPQSVAFYEIGDSSGLSTTNKQLAESFCQQNGLPISTYRVDTVTLNSILEPRIGQPIHFLKIDVEGAEKAVLEGIDLTRFRPWIILIESTEPCSQVQCHEEWEHYLLDGGYQHVFSDGLNRFYLADEKCSLASRFAYPVNVFDEVVPFQVAAAYDDSCFHLNSTSLRAGYEEFRILETQPTPRNFAEYVHYLRNNWNVFHELSGRLIDEQDELKKSLATYAALAAMERKMRDQLESRLCEAQCHARTLTNRIASLQHELSALEGSLTRQITKPLRQLGNWLSRIRRERLPSNSIALGHRGSEPGA